MSDSQQQIVDWLSRPATHGPEVDTVTRIDTHAARVFLAGDRAYKLKRAVRFAFLDFSTVDKRRDACAREVALNRRAAPSLYLDHVPVTRSANGALALGGEGPALDWLVVMRRFDQDTLFDRLATRGGLTIALVRDLADAIIAFHQDAPAAPGHGGAPGIAGVIEGNLATFRGPAAGVLPGHAVDRLEAGWRAHLLRCRPLLDARRDAGLVRHCHGDLHLRNICLVDGRPTLFDCIEFNDEIACVDVLYDLAFLLMDLHHRGLDALACRVLARYMAAMGGHAGLAALPLFLSLRAGVRAMVAAIEARTGDAEAARADAESYFDQAEWFLGAGRARARLICVGGLSGTGKSTLAHSLAPGLGRAPGALVVRSDVVRKHLQGAAPEAKLGPEGYTPAVTERVYDTIVAHAGAALDAGHSVILDAVFARPEERARARAVAESRSLRFDGLWLEAPPDLLEARVGARRGDASDATVDVIRAQRGYDIGALDWARVDAGGDAARARQAARDLLS